MINSRKLRPQVGNIKIFDIDPIKNYLSFILIESLNELNQSRFSTARRANKSNFLPFLYGQTYPVKYWVAFFIITKENFFKLELSKSIFFQKSRGLSDLHLMFILSIQNSEQIFGRLTSRNNIGHEIEIITCVPASPSYRHDGIKDIQQLYTRVISHDECSEIEENAKGKLKNQLRKSIE